MTEEYYITSFKRRNLRSNTAFLRLSFFVNQRKMLYNIMLYINQRKMLYNVERVSLSRGYNIHKYVLNIRALKYTKQLIPK